jgi:hypothetical protein
VKILSHFLQNFQSDIFRKISAIVENSGFLAAARKNDTRRVRYDTKNLRIVSAEKTGDGYAARRRFSCSRPKIIRRFRRVVL